MRILHTSDWHLGNRLTDESRLEEFRAFLEWLLKILAQEKVEALLVSGDIFDSTTPSDKARELYCDFLSRADTTGCRHIIVTAGNHDSVQMLQVAAPLLRRHHARVVAGLLPEQAETCLVPLCDAQGAPQVLVAAVPFLRPHDVSLRADAQDDEARRNAYVRGIAACYERVAQAAKQWLATHADGGEIRVVAMGHLSVTGVQASASTRAAVIGTVESVGSGIFDPVFDYVALGHIHQRRDLEGGRIRYCGSPLPMGFDEARTPGEVLLVDIGSAGVEVHPLRVPVFVSYREERCDSAAALEALLLSLETRGDTAPPVRLKLHYAGSDMSLMDIQALLDSRADACRLQSFCVMRTTVVPGSRRSTGGAELPTLQEVSPEGVFARRLAEWQAQSDPPMNEAHACLLREMFTQSLAEARAKLSKAETDSPSPLTPPMA